MSPHDGLTRRRSVRVALLAGSLCLALMPLGVTPVGMAKYFAGTDGRAPWLASKHGTGSVELLDVEGGGGGVSLEKVAALKPDLILAGQYFGIEAQYDKLARIAPVIAHQQVQLTDSWEEQTMVLLLPLRPRCDPDDQLDKRLRRPASERPGAEPAARGDRTAG